MNKSLTQIWMCFVQPPPIISSREKWTFVLFSGLFVFLFLLFFQPFGVNNYDPKETITIQFVLVMLSMGIVVSILMGTGELLISSLLIRILPGLSLFFWMTLHIIWLGTGIFLFYNILGGWHDFGWYSYLGFLGNVGVMSLIPFSGLLIYTQSKNAKKSLTTNQAYFYNRNEGDCLITFMAENQKDRFSTPLDSLLYLESEDNYVSIFHLINEKPTKTLFRKSLKSIQSEQSHPSLLRCHRSYMINLFHLQNIKGNKNKLQVFIRNVDKPIPVSRQYLDEVFALIKN